MEDNQQDEVNIEEKNDFEENPIIEDKIISTINPRIIFLRKLYFMIFLQLFLVGIITYCAFKSQTFNLFLKNNTWFFIVCTIFSILLALITSYKRRLIAKFPLNIISYFLFSLGISFAFAYCKFSLFLYFEIIKLFVFHFQAFC